ncbi:hypothetical protein DL96DRAFT_1815838 [Flagelloscypha sp. PMI_526]|nr:hypothetical protein DL96DRAFT_1815838 [Flagelloscypha sp. PMI_526]
MSLLSFPDFPPELRHLVWMEAADGGTKRDQCQLLRVCKESLQSVYPIFLETIVFDTSNSQTRDVASLETYLNTNAQHTLKSFSLSLRPTNFGQALSFTLSLPNLTHLSLHPSFNYVKWNGLVSSPSHTQAHALATNSAFSTVTHLSLGVQWGHTTQKPPRDGIRLFRALTHLLYHCPNFPDLLALRDFCEDLPPTLHLNIFLTEQHNVSPIDKFLQTLPLSKHRSVALSDRTEHLGYGLDSQFARWECQDALWEAGEKILAKRLGYGNHPVSYISLHHTD